MDDKNLVGSRVRHLHDGKIIGKIVSVDEEGIRANVLLDNSVEVRLYLISDLQVISQAPEVPAKEEMIPAGTELVADVSAQPMADESQPIVPTVTEAGENRTLELKPVKKSRAKKTK